MWSYILLVVCLLTALSGGAIVLRALGASSFTISVPPIVARPLNNDTLLVMIEKTEDWDGESIGAAGESGPWQMLPSTWRDYSRERYPYTERRWREPEAQRVLHDHASRIRDWMEKHRLPETAYTFAAFWKGGYWRVTHNRLRTVDKDYAQRAQNIFNELNK